MRDLPRNPGSTAQHLLQEIEQVSFQVHRKKQFDKPGASTHDLDLRRLTENERAELQTSAGVDCEDNGSTQSLPKSHPLPMTLASAMPLGWFVPHLPGEDC